MCPLRWASRHTRGQTCVRCLVVVWSVACGQCKMIVNSQVTVKWRARVFRAGLTLDNWRNGSVMVVDVLARSRARSKTHYLQGWVALVRRPRSGRCVVWTNFADRKIPDDAFRLMIHAVLDPWWQIKQGSQFRRFSFSEPGEMSWARHTPAWTYFSLKTPP